MDKWLQQFDAPLSQPKKRSTSSTKKQKAPKKSAVKEKLGPTTEYPAKFKQFPAGSKVNVPEQRQNPNVKRRAGGSYGMVHLKRLPVGFSNEAEYNDALQWGIVKQNIVASDDEQEEYYRKHPRERPQAYFALKRSKKTGKMKKKQLYGENAQFERMAYAAGRL